MPPTNEEIIAAIQAEGSIRKAAPALGYADDKPIRTRIKRDPDLAAALGIAPADEAPIDDPMRLAIASKDAELRELRSNVKKLSEALGKREEALAQMVEAARVPVPRPSFKVAPSNDTLPERSIVLPIYDIQFGQLVAASDTAFEKGEFSVEVFDQRLEAYVSKVIAYLRERAVATNFTELHIVLGGDLVEGDQIYPGMAWQLQHHPIRQVLLLRTKLGNALRVISRFARSELGVEALGLYAVPGNHGKVGGKRAGATPSDYSWDYLAAELLLDELRNEQLDIAANVASGALMFETLGHKFLAIHGDEIKGWGGLPFYGLAKADGRLIRMSEVIHDYLLMGHHHQPGNIPNGSGGMQIVSGDWVGANNLSRHILAGSRPQQNLLLVGAKYGITTEEHIYLDGDRRARGTAEVLNARSAA